MITLYDLPKVSLNKWYSGVHWTARTKLKKQFRSAVKKQFKTVYPKDKRYEISYNFYFKSRPLDADNCVAMIKLLTDVIFEDDSYKILDIGCIRSRKSDDERLEIEVKEIL